MSSGSAGHTGSLKGEDDATLLLYNSLTVPQINVLPERGGHQVFINVALQNAWPSFPSTWQGMHGTLQ